MNILFVSNLSGNLSEGPSYSVPNQVKYQAKFDNVFWYNLSNSGYSEWKSMAQYHDISEYPKKLIKYLPSPFNFPDLVVVEMFYKMAYTPIPYELYFSKVPYVIVPRGEFTALAQKNKMYKKWICNFLFFGRYARNARAIQYLTKNEKMDSDKKWNLNNFVIPNGAVVQTNQKEYVTTGNINCVLIGRIDINHKGLDLLMDACANVHQNLLESKVSLNIYGPGDFNQLQSLIRKIKIANLNDIVSVHNPVFEEEKMKVLLCADVFIMTSRYEGHPTALIEALSYGIPSLVTTGSNMRNEVEECDAGWGADNTVESISNALRLMIKDKDKFSEKGKNARDLAGKYSWDSIAKRSHDEYTKLIRKNVENV